MSTAQFNVRQILLCAIWFKAAWLVCVVFGTTGALLIWPVTLALCLKPLPLAAWQWKFAAAMVITGLITDSLLAITGVLAFTSGLPVPPFWLTTLWLLFGVLIVVALASIVRRMRVFVPLCAIGGTLAYHAGVAWSDVHFGLPTPWALVVLASTWAILGIVINRIYQRLLTAGDAHPVQR